MDESNAYTTIASEAADNYPVNILQRLGVELSLMVQGQNPELDAIMANLRAALRQLKHRDQLQSATEALFQYLLFNARSDLSAQQPAVREAALTDKFAPLLDELLVPDEFDAELEDLRHASGQVETNEQLAGLIEKTVQLLAKVNRQLSRSFTSLGSEQPAPGKSSWLKKIIAGYRHSVANESLLESLREVLSQLLDQIAIFDSIRERALELKEQLIPAIQLQDIKTILEQILKLLVQAAVEVNNDRENTEVFLVLLKEKLLGVEAGISSFAGNESLAVAEEFHTEMTSQVSGMRQDVDSSEDLNSLREAVRQRIEHISAELTRQLEAERDTHRATLARVEELRGRLRELEEESDTLRMQIQEKHMAAVIDPLTGVLNRSGYDGRVVEEFARSRRIGYPLSMLVIDVDHFKIINDNFGHKAGDRVLEKVANVIKERLRETDCIARYGGDEFVVLLPNTDVDQGLLVAESLRSDVENCGFHNSGEPVSVTLSIGVVEVKPGEEPAAAFERSDRAMYKAKKKRRNYCVAM